jgi:hypothetical protein
MRRRKVIELVKGVDAGPRVAVMTGNLGKRVQVLVGHANAKQATALGRSLYFNCTCTYTWVGRHAKKTAA